MDERKTPIAGIMEFLCSKKRKHIVSALLVGCLIFNVIWIADIFSAEGGKGAVYFLNVGQGDSEFIVFPSGAKLLIDGGPPNGKAEQEISRIIGPFDRYIDMVLLSHPQSDHFGGLVRLFEDYRVGAFLTNGEISNDSGYGALQKNAQGQRVEQISVFGGDVIRQGDNIFRVLSPPISRTQSDTKKENPNDRAILGELSMSGGNILFTGDVGKNIESAVMAGLGSVDVLKVAHHGSKYSSGEDFISAIRPKIAIVEVGKNSYGHPSPDVLNRFLQAGTSLYRTDRDGTIKITFEDGLARIFSLSSP